MPSSQFLFNRYMYICASIGYAEVPPSRVWCQWPRSGSAGSRQLQSGLSAAVPPVLHAVSGSPPPPACLCEICAKYQPGPACPPHAWLSELSSWSLSLWARLACLLSLWLPGRARHGLRLIRLRPVPPLIYRARHHRQQLNPSLNIPNSKLPILS